MVQTGVKARRLTRIAQNAYRGSSINSRQFIKPTSSFHPIYSPTCDPTVTFPVWLEQDRSHVLYHRVRQRILQLDTNTLWLTITTGLKVSKKSVIRKWCSRRVRSAVFGALRERGIRQDGKDHDNPDNKPQRLRGSLKLMVKEHVLTAPRDSIMEDARNLVYRLCRFEQSKISTPSRE